LSDELETTLRLLGANSIEDLNMNYINIGVMAAEVAQGLDRSKENGWAGAKL
jgi:hypothetical protein